VGERVKKGAAYSLGHIQNSKAGTPAEVSEADLPSLESRRSCAKDGEYYEESLGTAWTFNEALKTAKSGGAPFNRKVKEDAGRREAVTASQKRAGVGSPARDEANLLQKKPGGDHRGQGPRSVKIAHHYNISARLQGRLKDRKLL